ncbi:DEAD-like helicases superfamily protein [Paenibacillus sp. 32O-W]|uniref:DEAD/DEAH box helicase family protein n=1 Tax=Paenibacillus sp. 32O-W TaxID=1695218 RepID=UPI0007208278|nr:DEAD/DEAH box helicase family protein [Paenibacillus sp. 32O-W]ALS28818.1 DEAD-like helicases superfamily protein [Paenibacillus sp. 32O-W]
MNLNCFDFKTDYNKATDDIANEFYLPCMENSIKYDRISGYFGSTIYIIAWTALKRFVENGGKMRIICSPYIVEADQTAISEGYNARSSEVIVEALIKEINGLFEDTYLSKPTRALACLVALDVIDIKIAILESDAAPEVKRLFHDKVGIFQDAAMNCVGFRGSMNETFKGLSSDGNIESIDVFPNWLEGRDKKRVENAIKYFNELWENNIKSINVFDFPKAAKDLFTKYASTDKWQELVEEVKEQIDLGKKWTAERKNGGRIPRPHQIQALENWEHNGRRGIFEHATGSGKTYTAMCAIRQAIDRNEIPLVLVPSTELLTQWKKELTEVFSDIDVTFLICGDGNNSWKKMGHLSAWTQRSVTKKKIIIATMDTAASDQFLNGVEQGEHLFMVADEVHRLGSPFRRRVFRINTGARLGLSATPRRFGDEEGTNAIFSYFGGIIPPPFTLKDAISSEVLTKYFYYPHEIKLSNNEQKDWDAITEELSRYIVTNMKPGLEIQNLMDDTRVKTLLIQRARIIKNAAAKVELVLHVLKQHFLKGQRWIVYCDNRGQLGEVLTLLLNNGFDAYEYHSDMEGDKEATLRYFAINGGVLVSIKCLDEGVDIPATTHALIIASSKNPREFIQRRGRILRRAEKKPFAYLHDAIVTPNRVDEGDLKQLSIIEAELARAIQFGEWAENPSCITKLRNVAIDFNIDFVRSVTGGYEDEEE